MIHYVQHCENWILHIKKKIEELIERFIDQTGWLYPAVTDLNRETKNNSDFVFLRINWYGRLWDEFKAY